MPVYDEKIRETILDLIRIQLNDNVKARLIGGKVNNTYKTNIDELAIRSQTETYYYMKRLSENLIEEEENVS